jgi:hypothetical protein
MAGGAVQYIGKIAAVEDVVAEDQRRGLAADEFLTDEESLGDAPGDGCTAYWMLTPRTHHRPAGRGTYPAHGAWQ